MPSPILTIRNRLAVMLTELRDQQRSRDEIPFSVKLVADAMDTSRDSARRYFHGESIPDIEQYVGFLCDPDIRLADKLAIANVIHEQTGVTVRATDGAVVARPAVARHFDFLRQAVELARQDAAAWQDGHITDEEAAEHNRLWCELQTIGDEMRARIAAHVGMRRMNLAG